mgnify:CR=1 FL=1
MRSRAIIGIIAGVIVILSSFAHSILGWRQLGSDLTNASVSDELILGLEIGWHFAGVAMLAFGVIAIAAFTKVLRGERLAVLPIGIIAITYLVFGVYALLISKNPFFFIFIIPGAMLALGATGQRNV